MPMPRFTYCPSRSSWAARIANCSRVNMIRSSTLGPRGATLDALLVLTHYQVLHVDPGCVDLLRSDLADLDNLLHLGHRDLSRHRAQRIEIPRGQPVLKIARAVSPPGFHDCPVRADAALEYILSAI